MYIYIYTYIYTYMAIYIYIYPSDLEGLQETWFLAYILILSNPSIDVAQWTARNICCCRSRNQGNHARNLET